MKRTQNPYSRKKIKEIAGYILKLVLIGLEHMDVIIEAYKYIAHHLVV